jgi:hypothetical protein
LETIMTSRIRRLALIAATIGAGSLGLGTTGCIGPFEPCDDVGNFGIQVTVVDSVTGRPPPIGTTAFLILREGTYIETAQASLQISNGTLVVAAALERPGTYSLEVRVLGYQNWTISGVRVSEEGRCDNVKTVKLTARMQHEQPPS